MQVQAYTPDLEPAVRDFNARLRAGGSAFHFRESAVPDWLPPRAGHEIYQEYFVVVDGGAVRGGYILKHQPFVLAGETRAVTNVNLPLSEGSVNPAYGAVGVRIVADALRKRPLLYALGMGSYRNTIVRVVRAMGWSLCSIPFYFRIVRPERFLRHFQPLRRGRPLRLALDALAASGAGALAHPLHAALTRRLPARSTLAAEVVESFGPWADEVWAAARTAYSLIAVRDSACMNVLYPRSDRKAVRLKVAHRGTIVGWAVVLDTAMSGHKHFGAMRVGSVIDCLARPGAEGAVARAAVEFLAGRGVDLIVSNQSAAAWRAAFRRAGCLRGPSNFIFAASRTLSERLAPFDVLTTRMHVNRGDGEGPTHL
jgi:hypothetical protein